MARQRVSGSIGPFVRKPCFESPVGTFLHCRKRPSPISYPWPDSNRHTITVQHFECCAATFSPHGYFLCCAAPIRTGNTSAKNLGVTITPRRNFNQPRYKYKDLFLITKTFFIIFQKSWPGSTIFGSQRTVPAANACSNAASVAACRPNWNQCLYLARLAKTRQTPWASRAMYALTLFSILAFHPWFN